MTKNYLIPKLFFTLTLFLPYITSAQNYTSYITGSSTDVNVNPLGGICLMGGASEDDPAMRWFLNRANGGDILVLRASGSDGYNNYFYSDLGVSVNSVETIVFHNANASNETYIHNKIQQAEAIWIAGGDQWDYISYWRNTDIATLINEGITDRNIVIGGTSAGMAIQGGYYFTAENSTITSSEALSNPYDHNLSLSSASFIENDYLQDVITDTHYDNPDRKGRHITFLARIFTDWNIKAKGIACDEYTAVCIAPDGKASVYGGHPTYDDNAYFIQINCELENQTPENCSPNQSLHWSLGNKALKVYQVKGTSTGANYLDLNDWKTGSGGTWQNWYVNNGVVGQENSTEINCQDNPPPPPPTSLDALQNIVLKVYPNPTNIGKINISLEEAQMQKVEILNLQGKLLKTFINPQNQLELTLKDFQVGIYILKIQTGHHTVVQRFMIE